MLDSIYIGIAGMNAFSQGLKTISNNVANMNTPGFKGSVSSFSDMLYNNGSSGGAWQSGGTQQFGSGVRYNQTVLDWTAGTTQNTSSALDLSINGQGFLVLQNTQGQLVYVRTGSFQLKNGYVVQTGTDAKLMITTSTGALVPASTLGKENSAATATTKVVMTGAADTAPAAGAYTAPSTFTVYDNLGAAHTITAAYAANTATITSASGYTFQKTVTFTDSADPTNPTSVTVNFNSSGNIDPTTSTTNSFVVKSSTGVSSTVSLDFSIVSGNGSTSGSTVTLGVSATTVPDGHAAGTISKVIGTSTGKIEIDYTNGQKVALGDISLANFTNLQDLQQLGNNQYKYTGTGAPTYGVSSQAGLGAVAPSTLEGSNVNLSNEFGELILVQRGFQASSQIISTANEMLGHVFELRSQR